MSKKLLPPNNFRVVITPIDIAKWLKSDPVKSSDTRHRHAEEIAKQVKRHVDDWDDVSVEFDRPVVCEHCGYPWSEGDSDYNGGCCEADQSAYDTKHGFDAMSPDTLPADMPAPTMGEEG